MDWDKAKQKTQHALGEMIVERSPVEWSAQVEALSRAFYRSYPAEDMADVALDNLYGFIYGAWRSLQKWDGARAKVRIFNPDLERHGWESNHTVVVVLAADIPFLLDSVRGELNRQNRLIHKLHGQNFSLSRDEHGVIESVDHNGDGLENASLIYFELDHCAEREDLDALRTVVEDILGEVATVVDDFAPMRTKLAEVAAAVRGNTLLDFDRREEQAHFLQWLDRNHFTLLGYECLGVHHGADGMQVLAVDGSRLGILRLRDTRGQRDLTDDLRRFGADDEQMLERALTFSKSRIRSRVHRFAYPEYVEVSEFDDQGRVVLQHRFMGLFTSAVYTQSPTQIPIVREKVERVMALSGLDDTNHEGRELARVLELFPRDELFQADVEQLFATATAVNQIQERRQVRMFGRHDAHGKFYSCMVYMPRDRYTTAVRITLQNILSDALGAERSDFTTFFSESILVRIYFVLRLDADQPREVNTSQLIREIVDATESWDDRLRTRMIEEYGEGQGGDLCERFGSGFPAGYRAEFDTRIAVMDTGRMLQLDDGHELAMSLYRMVDEDDQLLRLRLFHKDTSLPLSDLLPILENLGLRVEAENPYGVRDKSRMLYWIQDFKLSYAAGSSLDLEQVRADFYDAFQRIWSGEAESDAFNRLLLSSLMDWREIAMLRGCAKYLKQIRFPFSTDYIAETLCEHRQITGSLVEFFLCRFDPDMEGDNEWREQREQELEARILSLLDSVANLGQDQIVRQYLALIKAMLRTNFFQHNELGEPHPHMSFKLRPKLIPGVPEPRPAYEIFVYSPRVEGVHLRGGKVARGGLRWSDRHEDFRTEVLGLVKAQQVKNAVIVPVGAKGGFVVKRSMVNASREEIQAEGVECYKTFIRGLLDITDNQIDGEVAPPVRVLRKDADDTYLVVAADKGTATFSDIANGLADDYGFWLGDAFASGGSVGYDHKKMGITARGAWVSVQRHFREMGRDVQTEPFTVIGVGDMAGDVFGNGMLLSDQIQLTAAFNHLHIFVDPNPDEASGFAERKRLFELDRSGWDDYNKELISEGGGVFSRASKSIPISPQMQERFQIDAQALTPFDLINALLKAPVDLLWNGGIGTYVKAASEQHSEVGDKANDGLRVNGGELRCKVVGEGGNLGMTQLGRVEFVQNGGRSNTDFIDNAAGVDCSDHEVNIKILLNGVVQRGDLTPKQRNRILEDMTDEVASMVLENNYRQVLAISLAEYESAHRMGEYQRMLARLEEAGALDRQLEFLPTDEEMQERKQQGLGLSRPELSVLISYSKGLLKEILASSDLPDDTYLAQAIGRGFPHRLLDDFGEEIQNHVLRREIIATQIANDLINRVGVSFVGRLMSSTGVTIPAVAAAYMTSRDVFGLAQQWQAVEALDFKVAHTVQMQMMVDLVRLTRRSSRWLLRNRRSELDPAQTISEFQPAVMQIESALPGLLQGRAAERVQQRYHELADAGVNSELAQFVAGADHLYAAMGIVSAAREINAPPMEVAEMYFRVGQELELDWFADLITGAHIETVWQALARDTYLEDLEWQQRSLAVGALKHLCEKGDSEACLRRWMDEQDALVTRWRETLTQLHATQNPDFAMFAVANRELLDLAQSSLHAT